MISTHTALFVFLICPLQGMLHYQSALLQSFTTLFYSLPMVLGVTEEKQTVHINLFEEYMEDSVSSLLCFDLGEQM